MNTVEKFRQQGWVIIKDFFTEQEINEIRKGTERSVAEKLKNDLLCNSHLVNLTVLNPKIISLVRELLQDTPVYIGDSVISHNDKAMSLHKDNPDRASSAAPDWTSDYTVLRMGIYLQDYSDKSGGLILRDGSHKFISRWKGKIINVKSSPRDLIIWNLRTTHSGNAKRLKLLPSLDLNPYICKLLPQSLFIPAPDTRMALFLSYGKNDHHMKRYIEYLKNRKYAVERWQNMNITPDLVEKGKKFGLDILDLVSDAKKIDMASVSEKHVELNY